MPPKPTRTPERISLPGGWDIGQETDLDDRELVWWLFKPDGRKWKLYMSDEHAQAFAAAMNGKRLLECSFQHGPVRDCPVCQDKSAKNWLENERLRAQIAALQSPAPIMDLSKLTRSEIEDLAKQMKKCGPISVVQSPAGEWRSMESAPKDGTVIEVYAPGCDGLPDMVALSSYHPDAGFTICAHRFEKYWRPFSPPAPTGER